MANRTDRNKEIKAELESDGLIRCPYLPQGDALYRSYHDEEWCQPKHDDGALYELFVIELFQAGLSWRTLLHKRENFRAAYEDFDVNRVAAFDEAKVKDLLQDAGIIRHEQKIRASIHNSRIFLKIQEEFGSFDRYIWSFTDGQVLYEPLTTTRNDLSDRVAKDLKRRGMKFAGSVTIYSYLQAIGVIYSHSPECFCSKRDGYYRQSES